MTLNITVLSPNAIHQSADFQLSEPERDAAGNWIVLQENAAKIVALRFEHWSGLITYCGLGSWNGKRTDQFVSEWLNGIGHQASFHDVLEVIRRAGSTWISDASAAAGKIWSHTFVLAAFEQGTLRIATVSNCQSLNGDFLPAAPDLRVDSRSASGTHVLVTGIRAAVTEEDKRLLKHIVESIPDYAVVQSHLADVNRRAAQCANASNGISMSCLTYSCGPHGQQSSRVHGDTPSPLIPLAISGDSVLAELIAQISRQNPNMKMVQTAYTTPDSRRAEAEEKIECQLSFLSGFADRSRSFTAHVETFGSINEYVLDVRAADSSLASVGNIRRLPDGSPRAYFASLAGDILLLDTLGGPVGYALDMNERKQVVGHTCTADNATHAFLWSERDGLLDLGTLGGRNSGAHWINNHGVVVGQSGLLPGDQRPYDEHAFIWTQETGMTALDPEFTGWSRAYAISNAGWIIGWRGRTSTECGYVWSRETGLIELALAPGRPFFATAINDMGLVVGEADDEAGKRRPFYWTREHGIRRIATDDPFSPRRVGANGLIFGSVRAGSGRWERPFMCKPDGELLPLPYPENHHTEITGIDASGGVVVGAARRDGSSKHVHPLRWVL